MDDIYVSPVSTAETGSAAPPGSTAPPASPAVLFSPASYNLPQFKFRHLPTSEVSNAWIQWIRWFENIMIASGISNSDARKAQMLAMGGIELQGVFYGLPGAEEWGSNAYGAAKQKLTNHFSPKQHDSFERFQFWSMKMENDEPIEKFLLRVQQKAEKCVFGKTELECRQYAIVDKIIQNAPEDLRRKLLEKDALTLDTTVKIVNAHQAVKYQAAQMKPMANQQVEVHRMVVKDKGPKNADSSDTGSCSRCGYPSHRSGQRCPALDQKCRGCHQFGHFWVMCSHRKRKSNFNQVDRKYNNQKRYRTVRNIATEPSHETEEYPVNLIHDDDKDEYITCRVGGVEIPMLIDSGSTHNLIDDATWEIMKLEDVTVHSERFDNSKRFLAYGRVPLELLTVFDAILEIQDGPDRIQAGATFYVIKGGQQALLGKITAQRLGLLRIGLPSTIKEDVNQVKAAKQFAKIKDYKLTLPINRDIPPVIQPLRRCPIALQNQVKAKLDELLEMDIIERVDSPTSWVSPLVPIMKDNGELRLCVDMRRANQAIQRLNHPLPVFEDMLPRFSGAKHFTTLDIKQAFHQVELAEDSRDITTFVTNWGLYRYKRLSFGINCAPEFYQFLMESILSSCPQTAVFIDDIIIWGVTQQDHDRAVKKVLKVKKVDINCFFFSL